MTQKDVAAQEMSRKKRESKPLAGTAEGRTHSARWDVMDMRREPHDDVNDGARAVLSIGHGGSNGRHFGRTTPVDCQAVGPHFDGETELAQAVWYLR